MNVRLRKTATRCRSRFLDDVDCRVQPDRRQVRPVFLKQDPHNPVLDRAAQAAFIAKKHTGNIVVVP